MFGVNFPQDGNDEFGVWFQLNGLVQKYAFAVKMSGNLNVTHDLTSGCPSIYSVLYPQIPEAHTLSCP